jgi:Cys-rich repeat protein
MKKIMSILIFAGICTCGDIDKSKKTKENTDGASMPECRTDEDCREMAEDHLRSEGWSIFLHIDNLKCKRNGVCSECDTDADCGEGELCSSATYCYIPNSRPCGDGICGEDEDIETCPHDCTPPPFCGDGICQYSEREGHDYCNTCPEDCGECNPDCLGDLCEDR